MNLLLPTEVIVPLLTGIGSLLLLTIPGVLLYGYLADRVQFEGRGRVSRDWFGGWDTLAATVLGGLFASVVCYGFFTAQGDAAPVDRLPDTEALVSGMLKVELVFVSILAGIVLVLKTGGFSALQSLGLRRYPLPLAVGQAVLLLLLAYPLIYDALALWRVLIASAGHFDDSQQEMVRFLAESKSQTAKLVVAVQAVVFAPVQEELIFRGYLYGVAKRHLGPAAGLIISSMLFAGIHNHLPSFAALFALAACLTLAYEWTGSILVPIVIHALFNLLSVVALFH